MSDDISLSSLLYSKQITHTNHLHHQVLQFPLLHQIILGLHSSDAISLIKHKSQKLTHEVHDKVCTQALHMIKIFAYKET